MHDIAIATLLSTLHILQMLHSFLLHYTVVDCGSLTDPDNGQVSTTTTTYTSTADYTCDTGYSLVGMNQRNCTAAGTWTDGEPTCNSEDHKYSFCKLYPYLERIKTYNW